MVKMIRGQWGFDCYFNNFRSNARGVAIFFNNNFEYRVIKEVKDSSGNILGLKLKLENKIITLMSIYGPNNDDPDFYNKMFNMCDAFESDDIIYYVEILTSLLIPR